VAILSDGGGQGTLAVDALAELGAPLASLDESTRTELRSLLGPAAAIANPVDLAGAADADPMVFARALEVLAGDDSVGPVLLVGLFGGYHIRFAEGLEDAEIEAARSMVGAMKRVEKGLVLHSMYASSRSEPLAVLGRAGVPVIESLDVACRCVAELSDSGGRVGRAPWVADVGGAIPPSGMRAVKRLPAGDAALTEPQARELLGAFGVGFPPSTVVLDAEAAASAWEELRAPAVVKVVWDRIIHKAAAGGVVLDVGSADEAREAFHAIERAVATFAAEHGLEAPPAAALVGPMVSRPSCELLVGAYRDPQLGPVLTVGFGGSWVEVVKEVSHRVLPVSEKALGEMLAEGRTAALLERTGAAGEAVRARVVSVAQAVADCIVLVERVQEIEINPLFVFGDRVVPIDARVIVSGG
jgi:acetyltransferase